MYMYHFALCSFIALTRLDSLDSPVRRLSSPAHSIDPDFLRHFLARTQHICTSVQLILVPFNSISLFNALENLSVRQPINCPTPERSLPKEASSGECLAREVQGRPLDAAEAAAAAAAGVGNVQLSENEDEEEKEEEGKEDDDTTDDERLQNISEAARHVEVNSKSNRERVSEQAQFEEYMQAVHPNSKYVKDFLSRLKGKEAGVYLVAPEEKHLLSYMYHCRDTDDSRTEGVVGRSNKGSNIRKKLNFISGTLIEFDHAKLHRTKKMMELITLWEGEDDVARALSFLPEIVMPKAWKALWSLKISDKNKRRLWARFLVQFALVARSSDVAGEYFPLMENVSFPPDAKHYLEDGNPMYIDVVFTKWKGRPLSQGSTPYTIRLWHNPQDLRFCPVHWLTRHWADLGRTTGPMFDNISARTYQRHLKKLFSSIQYKLADGSFDVVDCSSHSIRRAAAQWAARCGASLADVRNVGRWVALKHLLTYIAEGVEMRSNALRAYNDDDPVLSVWEFNVETVVSSIASTNEVLIALGNSRR